MITLTDVSRRSDDLLEVLAVKSAEAGLPEVFCVAAFPPSASIEDVVAEIAAALARVQERPVIGLMLEGRRASLASGMTHAALIGTVVAFEEAGKRTDHRTFMIVGVDRAKGEAVLDSEPDAKPGATMVKA